MSGRELAWRVLAQELQVSLETEKGSGERAPSYLISPLGARMNRAAMVGTLSPPEASRSLASGVFRRARLSDPTGVVSVTAGSFQAQGLRDLESITVPTRVLLIGKTALYRGAAGPPSPSVRAEGIVPIPDGEYRSLLAEAATQTLQRMQLVERVRDRPTASDADFTHAGAPAYWIRGARLALHRYPTTNFAPFLDGLRAVLVAVGGPPATTGAVPVAGSPEPASSPGSSAVRRTTFSGSPRPRAAPAGSRGLEARLLEILDQLADQSADGYADMDELAERAARSGIDGERLEELLNGLAENGTLEEPLVGKFRRAEGPPPV